MTVSFLYDALIYTQRFNHDWSEVDTTLGTHQIRLDVPDAETSFTIGEYGQLNGDELADHQLFYPGVGGDASAFLSYEHPVAISHVMHSGDQVTDVMQFDIHIRSGEGDTSTLVGFDTIYLYLDGDPLPTFANSTEFDNWMRNSTGWWTPPESGPYSAGMTPGWGDFDIPSEIVGTDGNDRLEGTAADDTIRGGDGQDTLIGGDGDDTLIGGESEDDLRDVLYGGDGNDDLDGGYGNDQLRGDAGMDTIVGGFGVDEIFGGDGDDQLTGQAWSDLIFGGAGDDFINGGFGFDRVNGGDGADRFFHLGIADHGSDWIQDYDAAEGDVLVFGAAATRDQFQVNFTETQNAGDAGVEEAFVIYRPTGQILWALVDGGAQTDINLVIAGTEYDLLA